MERRFAEGREREICPACSFVFYRNPVPAVGVVVAMDGRVVLVRRRYEPRAGCWGLPAGYMELDESAEEAAVRECHEETGLLVQIDHLLGVYSFGEGQQSGLVIIYAATAVGGVLAAGDDATEAGVFLPDALPAPFAFRSHFQAIERWRRESLPIHSTAPPPAEDLRALGVRGATRADAPAVLDLLLDERSADPEQRLAADALFHDWLHNPDRPILVGELAGAVAGVAILGLHQALWGWYATLDGLAVTPALRRQGLGTALVTAATQVARARGCGTLHVVAAPEDEGAQVFLTARGFVAEGVWTTLMTPE
jgi:ADP-ribose pyrophosphatase YjhB (NUDIX family)/GNAT superfamily N-acetyltransferase